MAKVHYASPDPSRGPGLHPWCRHGAGQPDRDAVTCSFCLRALERAEAEAADLAAREAFARNPVTEDWTPDPLEVSWSARFTFSTYTGEYAYRGTANRWWVFEDGKRIGRITQHGDVFVAYDESYEWGSASEHASLQDACLALSHTFPGNSGPAGYHAYDDSN